MPTTATYRVMTEPQRRLRRQIEDLAGGVVRFARRSARSLRDAVDMGERLDVLNAAHPDYEHANIRDRVLHWTSILALAGAACLDAILAAPVAEHLLTTYAHASAGASAVGRFGVPLLLIGAELGIGLAIRQAIREGHWLQAAPWIVLGMLPVVVMPILVGETEHMLTVLREAQATGMPVSQAGLFDGPIPVFTLAMMGWTAFIHAYVVYGPHHESASYALWSVRSSWLRSGKRNAEERARGDANTAGDRFSQFVTRRAEYVSTYPDWPLGTPNWSEASVVLERAFGYPVITGPNGGINHPVFAAPAPDRSSAPQAPRDGAPNPVRPAAASPGVASSQPAGPESTGLDDIMEQRRRESDAAVSL